MHNFKYYKSGKIHLEEYLVNGIYHRLDGPACIWHYEDGQIQKECYYINRDIHRLDGPAIIWYYEDGKIKEEYYHLHNNYLYKLENYKPFSIEKLFEYIKEYPKYIKEIELLARHNNWLDEEQLFLLNTITTFSA